MIAVTGASGNVGGKVADRLLQEGREVGEQEFLSAALGPTSAPSAP